MEPTHGEEFTFTFGISLDDLIELRGMEDMNEYMDEQLSKEYPKRNIFLTDISYKFAPVFKEPAGDWTLVQATGIIEDVNYEQEDE